MTTLDIHVIPCLESNYTYLLRDGGTGTVGVVDPGEAAPVAAALEKAGWTLDFILLTHHHGDHIDGVAELVSERVVVAGAADDSHRLPPLDVALQKGENWQFGERPVQVFDVSGHTLNHIALHFPEDGAVFSGDCIFPMGCGRIFEGTALQMWESLSRIAALPDETRIYCGHEMAEANGTFCLSIAPDHEATKARMEKVKAMRAGGKPTVPSTVGEEKATNIFLRAGEESVAAKIGMAGGDAAAVFAELRRRKDLG